MKDKYEITSLLKEALYNLKFLNDGDAAAMLCYWEINDSKNKLAWLILALIRFQRNDYQSAGMALQNSIGEGVPQERLYALLLIVEQCIEFLGEELCYALTDFLSGMLKGEPKASSEDSVISFLKSDWDMDKEDSESRGSLEGG